MHAWLAAAKVTKQAGIDITAKLLLLGGMLQGS